MVPGGPLGISGVESGKAAPLVGGPPGVELHTTDDELPSGATADIVPVALPRIDEGMVPSGVAGVIASDDIVVADDIVVGVVDGMDEKTVLGTDNGIGMVVGVAAGGGAAVADEDTGTVEPGKSVIKDVAGCADSVRYCTVELVVVGADETVGAGKPDGIVAVAIAGVDITGAAGVPCTICPVGAEQVTAVPGVVGSEAIGTGASVVSGVPGWVAAENGLGPLSGEVTMAPGVVGRPIAVLPMVDTCARQAVQLASSVHIANSDRRIFIDLSSPP
jgi:hypothetical protein